jgi:Ca2+-binding EF-hand superfamily protein
VLTLACHFVVFRCFDVDADNYISFEEFVKGMSVFLKGKFEERLKFCFRIYDLNGDRYISKEEMFQLLKNCLVKVRAGVILPARPSRRNSNASLLYALQLKNLGCRRR